MWVWPKPQTRKILVRSISSPAGRGASQLETTKSKGEIASHAATTVENRGERRDYLAFDAPPMADPKDTVGYARGRALLKQTDQLCAHACAAPPNVEDRGHGARFRTESGSFGTAFS